MLCIPHENDLQLVLIYFTLVGLDVGDEGGTPVRPDIQAGEGLLHVAGVDEDVVDEYWLPALEFEY